MGSTRQAALENRDWVGQKAASRILDSTNGHIRRLADAGLVATRQLPGETTKFRRADLLKLLAEGSKAD